VEVIPRHLFYSLQTFYEQNVDNPGSGPVKLGASERLRCIGRSLNLLLVAFVTLILFDTIIHIF
jgi:hypothetical protein